MMEKFSENQKRVLGGLGGNKQQDPRDALQERGFPLPGYEIETERSREAHITAFRMLRITEASIPSRVFAIDFTLKGTTMDQIKKEQRNKMQQHMTR